MMRMRISVDSIRTGAVAVRGAVLALSFTTPAVIALNAQAEISFHSGIAYPVGDRPLGLATGDFNNDGWIDLVITTRDDDGATVLMNTADGSGTFSFGPVLATGPEPRTPGVGDLNGDGLDDIVTPHWETNATTLGVFLGVGDMQFAPMTLETVGARPRTAVTGDFDGDGIIDVAAANLRDDNVSVLLNLGDAVFAPHEIYGFQHSTGSVATGDIDLDGDLDLVATSRLQNTAWLLRNQGDGTFIMDGTFPTGFGPKHEALADIDGDGDLDIVTADGNAPSVTVLANDGAGNFVTLHTLPAFGGPHAVAAEDFDGDGDCDIMCAALGVGVLIFEQLDDASFADARAIANSGGADFLGAADFNGDGRADLAVANQSDDLTLIYINRSTLATCPADFDLDGIVGITDLITVLSNWDVCQGCPADLDDSGVVDFGDLIEILLAWGDCPMTQG